MNLNSNIVKLLGISIIGLILAGATAISFVLGIGILTKQGVNLPNFNTLNKIQRVYYFGGIRNIWQYQPDCVDVGGNLIYQPKNGRCFFENLEFSNMLTFDEEGRANNFYFDPNLPRIAVLGDSHAMGWGVEDNNTFSAQLQSITNRKVYNLGVSSYATERELDRLALIKNLNSINTVIIQYCDNDVYANNQYPINRNLALDRFNNARHSYIALQNSAISRNFYKALKSLVPEWIKLKIKNILGLNTIISINESMHRHSIESVLTKYSELLKNKKIYVIFISGRNSLEVPRNWVGNYNEHELNVNFIDVNMKRNHFYRIDDHLNEYGHKHIATRISRIIGSL